MSGFFFYAALDWMSYLHHPPPSSWVARTAATFRILALLLILPCIFLTALDVASYLVVRTLGADSAHRLDPVNPTTDYPVPYSTLDAAPGPRPNDRDSHKPPPQFDASATGQTHPETFFSTSSDANFALAGEGIFSPPGSRSASPPTTRNQRTACFGTISECEEIAVMRKRG